MEETVEKDKRRMNTNKTGKKKLMKTKKFIEFHEKKNKNLCHGSVTGASRECHGSVTEA